MKLKCLGTQVCLVLLVVAGLVPAGAAQLEVTYVEGKLDLRQSGAWKTLEMGDMIADNATVQFDGDGVAELEGAGVKVTLRQKGVYQVADIVSKTKEVSATGLGSLVKGRVAGVFQGSQKSVSAAMGVRGAEVTPEGQRKVNWAGSAADLLAQSKELLLAKDYEKALAKLKEAYGNADELEEPEILYYTAYAKAMVGESGAALDTIVGAKVPAAHPLYGEYLILQGQLLVDALSFKDAFSSFDGYRRAFPAGAESQLADLMAGYCASQIGDREEARRSLSRAQSADPASELGRKAQDLLGKL